MPQFTMTKNWDDAQAPISSWFDDIKQSLETFVNNIQLDSTNIQTSGVATSNLLDGCVTADKIATSAATTAKFATNSVSRAKLADVNYALSSSCGASYTNATSTYTDITNLTVTITTTGRPVLVGLVVDGTGGGFSGFFHSVDDTTPTILFRLMVDDASTKVYQSGNPSYIPGTFLIGTVSLSAAAHTIKLQLASGDNSTTINAQYMKLYAYEL